MKLVRSFVFATTATAAFFAVVSAGGCSSGPADGDSGGKCFSNMTCNSGLTCVLNLCQSSEGGAEGGPIDSGKDTNKPDTQPADTGPMCPTPGDVTGFTPPTYVPAKRGTVCNSGQVSGYVTNCWMMGGMCQPFKTANPACVACMESNRKDPMTAQNDATFGPVYIGNGLGFLNIGGCIEVLGELNCAKATQALAFCTYEACDTVCSIPPETSTNYNTCTTKAATTKCSMYNTAVTAACVGDAAAAATTCRPSGSFQAALVTYGNLFCGGGPSDASTDG